MNRRAFLTGLLSSTAVVAVPIETASPSVGLVAWDTAMPGTDATIYFSGSSFVRWSNDGSLTMWEFPS